MITVDKDFGNQDLKNEISAAVLGWHPYFQWIFAPASNIVDEDRGFATDKGDKVYEHPMMVSIVGPNHPFRPKIVSLLNSFMNKHGIKCREIQRIKINFVSRAHQDSLGKWQMPHVDSEAEHKVFLYYINDADGDTYLFNEKYQEGKKAPETFTIDQAVTPEAGKAVVFDGNIYHAPSAPIESDFRVAINIDFV